MKTYMTPPFPYFGGKRRAAPYIWPRFGEPYSYIEPFFGGGSVLLANPTGPAKREIVNDIDGLLANFWRALKADPEKVAYHADYPTSHLDLTCLLYTSPSPRDRQKSRMPSAA